jgi:hypothetical protein
MALTPALAELGSRLGAAVERAEEGAISEDEAPPPILEVSLLQAAVMLRGWFHRAVCAKASNAIYVPMRRRHLSWRGACCGVWGCVSNA